MSIIIQCFIFSYSDKGHSNFSLSIASKWRAGRECCGNCNVPSFCIGLCTPAASRSALANRLNACSKHKAIIEKCVKYGPPKKKGNH